MDAFTLRAFDDMPRPRLHVVIFRGLGLDHATPEQLRLVIDRLSEDKSKAAETYRAFRHRTKFGNLLCLAIGWALGLVTAPFLWLVLS